MGFKDELKKAYEEGKLKEQERLSHKTDFKYIQEKKNSEKQLLKELDEQGIPYCPKCKSQSVQYLDRHKKLSIGRAIVGSAISPLGAVVGAVTSKKHNGVMKCLKCGNEWKLK